MAGTGAGFAGVFFLVEVAFLALAGFFAFDFEAALTGAFAFLPGFSFFAEDLDLLSDFFAAFDPFSGAFSVVSVGFFLFYPTNLASFLLSFTSLPSFFLAYFLPASFLWGSFSSSAFF